MAGDLPAPPEIAPPPVPPPQPPPAAIDLAGSRLLGFAVPVTQVPPIEDFLPLEPAAAPPAAPTEFAALEHAPPPEPVLEPEPEAEHEPESPPLRPRVRDLPPASEPAGAQSLGRPENLVGRLGRRIGEAAAVVGRARAPETALHLAEPAPLPSPPTERSGRPALSRNRRLYRRARLPAEIEIGGAPCTLIDVSIGGFAATSVPPLEPNTLLPVTIRLVIDGIEVGTQLHARIVYVTQGRSSGRFVDLSPSQMAFLRYIVTWRGESVGAVGTTTLLDAISSGGVERGFSALRSEDAPKSRWWAGLIGKKVEPPR